MKKLAIVTTHPIQYYAPVFKLLHERRQIGIKIFYTRGETAAGTYDPGFSQKITWDIPLLEGYPYEWAVNTSADPGSHHYNGIINPGLPEQISAWQPDALLVIGWAYNGHLKTIRYYKNKIPVFFRGDSTLLDEKWGIRAMARSIFLKWVYRHIDHAFYNGTRNKEYFKKYGLAEHQLSFAPHAIDNERFHAERNEEVQSFKKSLGLANDDLLVLFSGKLEEKKDPTLLLEAFLSISQPGVHLLFTGNGVLENTLKSRAGAYPNIHFAGFQNQTFMPMIYQACDLFCLPSKGPAETWGLAVNEAMACEKAILVSDKCGCAIDLVRNGENGAIFKSGSLNGLATCLKKLVENKEVLTAYGKVSGQIIKSWDFLGIVQAIEHKLLNE